MMSGTGKTQDLNQKSGGGEKSRKFLIYAFVPVFLFIGIGLVIGYYAYPVETRYDEVTSAFIASDNIALGIKNSLGDWFKLWIGAFIGFVSAIVTYYFSKEEG